MRFIFIVLSFMFIGLCSSKKVTNDDYSKLIIGRWDYSTMRSVVTNEKGERVYDLEDDKDYKSFKIKSYLLFKSDGTGINDDPSDGLILDFKWSVKGSLLTMHFDREEGDVDNDDEEEIVTPFKMRIMNDVLTLIAEDGYESEEYTFNRITTVVFHRAK